MLNPTSEQSHALDQRHLDACVVAGPGSGKTTVLVERFRRLIEEDHIDPHAIAAITFTEKAAANMKAKLLESFAHDETLRRDLESAWVSTIHGFCARLLKENALTAGIDPRFRVLDARDAERARDRCLTQSLDEFTAHRRDDALALIDVLASPSSLPYELASVWDAMRSAGIDAATARLMPDPAPTLGSVPQALRELVSVWPRNLTPARATQKSELLDWADRIERAPSPELLEALLSYKPNLRAVPPECKEALESFREKVLPVLVSAAVSLRFARFRSMLFDVLARFEELYEADKKSTAALDFNDLERITISLLQRHPDVLDRVRGKFLRIMLDEFQDINPQQDILIRLLRAPDSFFGVGDINQSIYGFRHARTAILREFESDIRRNNRHSARLSQNFRSRQIILDAVSALLLEAPGIEERALTALRPFHHKDHPSLEVLCIHTATEEEETSEDRESRWIAHRIANLRGTLMLTGRSGDPHPADFKDFAILCRNSGSMPSLLRALDEAGIPWICGRRESYLDSREGRDLTALLHIIANPRNSIALATVLRGPLCGLSDEALLHLRPAARAVPDGLYNLGPAALSPSDAAKYERFSNNLRRWRATQPVIALDLLLSGALTDCGLSWIPGTPAGDNIESYLQLARTRGGSSSGNARPLLDFLADVEHFAAHDPTNDSDLSDKDMGNRVQVMTAHSAKGLEFPVVILANMDKGTRRESAALSFTPTHGLGVKWKLSAKTDLAKKDIKDSWHRANAEEIKTREDEETHRLLYVAMTRAEEHLILSWSRGRNRPGKWARLVENFFQLDGRPPANSFFNQSDPLPASVLIADQDPPLVRADSSTHPDTPVLTLEPLPLAGQHDSSVNVTALTAFAACPRRYYLERYLGWTGRPRRFDPEDVPADTDSTPAAELGSLVHALLASRPGEYPAEAHALANVFVHSPLGQRASASARSAREWDFILDLDGTLVSGSIDLWFEEKEPESDGALHIVDYKTDDVSATDTAARAQHYAPQLALYAVALERAFGRPPASASLHFLRPNVVVDIPLPADAAAPVRLLVEALRQAQQSHCFDLNESPACPKCPFFHNLCPATL